MQPTSSHVASITGLRAIAVLAVVLFHLDPTWMPGGFVGVDIFFVISGFVVAHSVMARPAASWRVFVSDFYGRRLARLYPALLAYVAVATTLSVLFIPLVEQTRDFERFGAAAALGLSNFLLKDADAGYFALGTDFNPFAHTWSLGVEEQYYLLFSLFAFPLLLHSSRRIKRTCFVVMVLAAAASLAASAVLTASSQSFAFYMLPTRFWELALGLLLRVVMDQPFAARWTRAPPVIREAVPWAALLLLIGACWITPEDGFPFPGALLPCAATAALIGACWLWRDCRVARVLSSRLPLSIGLASYSLYLWHWGVIVFMRWTVGVDTFALKMTGLLLTFALGFASYRWIEAAFTHPRASKPSGSSRTIRLAATTGLVAMLCLQATGVKPRVGLAAASRLDVWYPYTEPPEDRPCKARLTTQTIGNNRFLSFDAPCRKADARQLFVLGDSHAGAYQRMLWRIAETGDWDVHAYVGNGCGFVNFRMSQRDPSCEAFTELALTDIRGRARKGDIIFLPALQTERFRTPWGAPLPSAYETQVAPAIVDANRDRLAGLAALGLPTIVEGAKPVMQIALFRCADWFNRNQTYCRSGASVDKAAMLARMRPPQVALERIVSEVPGVTIWDPSELLCPGRRCDGYDHGRPLFFDVDHLSAYANDMLAVPFRELLETMPRWGGPAIAGTAPAGSGPLARE